MNTRNTISTEGQSKLDRSLLLLGSLTEESLIPILDYLTLHGSATSLDLLIHTRIDASELEEKLELLCQLRILQLRKKLYTEQYTLDRPRLQKIIALARSLGRGMPRG